MASISMPVFLPGKSHEQRRLVGYRPKGHKESDTAKHTDHQQSSFLGLPYLPGQLPRVFLRGKSQDSSNTFCLSCTVYVCVCVGGVLGPWVRAFGHQSPFVCSDSEGKLHPDVVTWDHLGLKDGMRTLARENSTWTTGRNRGVDLWCVHGQSAQMVMPRGAHRTQESSLEG